MTAASISDAYTGDCTERSAVRVDWNARAALGAFIAVLAVAFVLYVDVGRHYWFLQDDWAFLISRDGGNVQDLFRESHEHWSTVPILVYRAFWRAFGLNYRPYLVLVVSLHLTVAVLLRIVMRRVGVGPWIATSVTAMFVLLAGSAWNNIVWSFQIGFVGSLACGLTHLLCADHDGPFARRDVVGLGFGVVGLMCSGIGVTMTAVVGLAVLIRRGWRLAAFHIAPLGLLYLAWYFSFERRSYRDSGGAIGIVEVLRFVSRGLSNAFDRFVRVPGGSALLATVLVVGLVLAWKGLARSELRRRAAAPGALLAGAPLSLIIIGAGRGPALHTSYATATRFVHIVAVFVAPALAVAADALARRWRILTPVLCILLLAGAPANVRDLWPENPVGRPDLVLAVASVPGLERIPRSVHPLRDKYGEAQITVGWLVDGVQSGRIERREHVPPDLEANALLRVALQQEPGDADATTCRPFRAGTRQLQAGDAFQFRGTLLVELSTASGGTSLAGTGSRSIARLEALLGPLTLRLGAISNDTVECG